MRVDVKICGLKTAATLAAALDAGARYVGLVFFPKSPRNVDLATAAALAQQARGRADIVALTVDADDALLRQIAETVAPDLFQLHGRETAARCRDVRARFDRRVMKAIAVASASDAEAALDYTGTDLILFDAKPPSDAPLPGGNGAAFDWQALAQVAPRVDWMLSGGLTPANVADAVRATGARRVDVSSGVERRPGEKDEALIRAFIAAAQSA